MSNLDNIQFHNNISTVTVNSYKFLVQIVSHSVALIEQ